MGAAGGNSTAYQTNIPQWARDAHLQIIQQAQRHALDDPYPGSRIDYQRIEGFSPQEQAAFAAKQSMYEQGDPYANLAGQMAQQAARRPDQMTAVSSGYGGLGSIDPGSFGDTAARQYDFGTFGGEQAQQYMNPYWESVVEEEEGALRDEFARQKQGTAAQRIASGSRGGYRAALEDMMGQTEQAEAISGLRGRGAKSAYESAQQQYERDRTASMGAGRMNEQSIMNAQQRFEGDRQAYMRAVQMGDQSAMAKAKMDLDASKYNQDMILRQAEAERQSAQLYTGVGQYAQQGAYDRIRQMEMAGATQREMQQAARDMEYEEKWNELNWPQQQLAWLQGIVGGVPAGMQTMTQSPSPNLLSQFAGAGMTGAALSGLFGNR